LELLKEKLRIRKTKKRRVNWGFILHFFDVHSQISLLLCF